MASETEPVQLNLGALRSAMSLTLHTHHASRVWHGRAQSDAKPGIMGLNGFVAIMNRMRRGAEQDDPYSDWWMLRIEEKLSTAKEQLQLLSEQVDQALAGVPAGLSLGENLNVQPVRLPLFVSSPLGFMAVYLLADFDALARRVILAHHTALIDRDTMEQWLNEGAHPLRSLFAFAQRYRYSGTTRDDFASMNAAARAALEKFGEMPQDVLEGTRRSRFAPPIARRQRLSPNPATDATDDNTGNTEAAGTAEDADDENAVVAATAQPNGLPPDIPVVTRRSRSTTSAGRRSRQSSSEATVSETTDAPAEDGEGAGTVEVSGDSAAEGEDSAETSDDDEGDRA